MNSILGSSSFEQLSATKELVDHDITKTLNFGNISKPISFNMGDNQNYCKVRPKALLPSKNNPRPDWQIDDNWLIKHVGIDMEDIFESNQCSTCLVKIEEKEIEGKIKEIAIYPKFEELINYPNESCKKDYDFLIDLSKSIREIGQIQPIEIESDSKTNSLVVLEGHLRRLACILGRVPYLNAIRNEGLQNLTQREKRERQITENSLRFNVSLYGNFKLAFEECEINKSLTVRELSNRLKINKDLASAFIKIISNPNKFHSSIFDALKGGFISSKAFIKAISIKRLDKQELFINKILNKESIVNNAPRGREGRKKSIATFTIKNCDNCIKAGKNLFNYIPDLKKISGIDNVQSVEDMISVLKALESLLLK